MNSDKYLTSTNTYSQSNTNDISKLRDGKIYTAFSRGALAASSAEKAARNEHFNKNCPIGDIGICQVGNQKISMKDMHPYDCRVIQRAVMRSMRPENNIKNYEYNMRERISDFSILGPFARHEMNSWQMLKKIKTNLCNHDVRKHINIAVEKIAENHVRAMGQNRTATVQPLPAVEKKITLNEHIK